MSLLITVLMIPAILAGIVALTLWHLPVPMKACVAQMPSWFIALATHVLVALWIGGVTGHLFGFGISLWLFLISYLWLKDELMEQTKEFWEAWWLKDRVKVILTKFNQVYSRITSKWVVNPTPEVEVAE